MKFSSANFDSLRNLYLSQVQKLLSSEQQIAAALPGFLGLTSDAQLRQLLETHLEETAGHIWRLEQILKGSLGEATAVRSRVMAAMLGESGGLVSGIADSSVRDAAIIAAAQQIEQFEIACYGTLRHFARVLGETAQAQLLDQTIQEEGRADHVLTGLAGRMNAYARFAA